MNAAEIVPVMADRLGVDPANLRVVDRALADAGLRRKKRGSSIPEVSRREALYLLLGAMTSSAPLRAATAPTDVTKWAEMRKFGLAMRSSRMGVTESNYIDAFGPNWREVLERPLIDVMVFICDRFANDEIGYSHQIEFKLDLRHGVARIASGGVSPSAEASFCGENTTDSGGLWLTAHVGGDVLYWIAKTFAPENVEA